MPCLELTAGSIASRAAALSLTALIAFLLLAGLALPLLDLAKGRGDIADLARLLQEQRRLASRTPALAAERTALLAAPADLRDYLPGGNPALAGAELQSRLGGIVKGLGGQLVSLENVTLPDQEGFRRAGLRLRLTLRQESLPSLLYAIEAAQPRLFIGALSIKSDSDGVLAVSGDIFGYLAQAAP